MTRNFFSFVIVLAIFIAMFSVSCSKWTPTEPKSQDININVNVPGDNDGNGGNGGGQVYPPEKLFLRQG